jgi:hypothetical protein
MSAAILPTFFNTLAPLPIGLGCRVHRRSGPIGFTRGTLDGDGPNPQRTPSRPFAKSRDGSAD